MQSKIWPSIWLFLSFCFFTSMGQCTPQTLTIYSQECTHWWFPKCPWTLVLFLPEFCFSVCVRYCSCSFKTWWKPTQFVYAFGDKGGICCLSEVKAINVHFFMNRGKVSIHSKLYFANLLFLLFVLWPFKQCTECCVVCNLSWFFATYILKKKHRLVECKITDSEPHRKS